MQAKSNIARLLPRGAVRDIAKQLGLSPGSASTAIRRANPTHPAVQEAVRRIEASGVVATVEKIAAFPKIAL